MINKIIMKKKVKKDFPKTEGKFQKIKNSLEIVQIILIILTIIFTGAWSIQQGVWELKDKVIKKKIEINHKISNKDLKNGKRWIQVALIVKNIGKTSIHIDKGQVYLQQIYPIGKKIGIEFQKNNSDLFRGTTEVVWDRVGDQKYNDLGDMYLEPDEEDTTYYDFFIPSNIQFIKVYTFINKETKKGEINGWRKNTVLEIFDKERL